MIIIFITFDLIFNFHKNDRIYYKIQTSRSRYKSYVNKFRCLENIRNYQSVKIAPRAEYAQK